MRRRYKPFPLLEGEQAEAVDPTIHAAVKASAGTGKTQVLTGRVLNLLLSGALSSYRASVTADDLETVRRQLGVQRLNVVGVGDGADAVAAWATAHADSVGRVVLDGPSDPTRQDPDRTEDATSVGARTIGTREMGERIARQAAALLQASTNGAP